MGAVKTRKPRRILVWGGTREQLKTLATRLGWKVTYTAAENGHGYWIRQPGPKSAFEGTVRVFPNDFDNVVKVTVGRGENKHVESKVVAFARAGQ